MSELNENVSYTISDHENVSVPVDDTLSIAGQAADAKAVGDALARKMDADAMHISVNGQQADNYGAVLIDGTDIPVGGEDSRSLAAAIAAGEARNGADIPLSDEDERTIAQAIENIEASGAVDSVNGVSPDANGNVAITGANVPVSGTDTRTIARAIQELSETEGGTVRTVDGIGPDANGNVALSGYAKSVNGETPDADGDITISSVSMADNLSAENAQATLGAFAIRTTGGNASIEDGDAWALRILGNCQHVGKVAESIRVVVTNADRDEDEDEISATYDRAALIAGMGGSGTVTLNYTSSWSPSPSTYGITVSGTPKSGDAITITYTAANPGTIYPARPTGFVSTGWNLYDDAAKTTGIWLPKYSDSYGYRAGGYTGSIQYAATRTGTKSTVTVTDGRFNIPADGYVFIAGGNAGTTYLYPTWSDWLDRYEGSFEAYSESVIDFSTIMSSYFPYGLLSVGSLRDEIDLNTMVAVSRIGRMAYSAANLETAIASGRAYDYDGSYIYLEKETPDSYTVTLDGGYVANDHGIEKFIYADANLVPVWLESIYGANLKNKLERDVLTISSMELSDDEKKQARDNIGALGTAEVEALIGGSGDDGKAMLIVRECALDNISILAGKYKTNQTIAIETVSGYTPIGIVGWRSMNASSSGANCSYVRIYNLHIEDGSIYWSGRDVSSSKNVKFKLVAYVLYLKG